MMGSKSFMGTSLQTSARPGINGPGFVGRQARSGAVQTQAFFSKLRKADKKEVERAKNSQVVKAKRLLPFDEKLKKTAPKRTFNMDAARNKPREGGFGQGKPFQKQKIGPKMEGTSITSNIDPVLFVAGLAGFTVVTVGGLILTS